MIRHAVSKEPVSEICEELELAPNLFYRWQKEFLDNATAASGTYLWNWLPIAARENTVSQNSNKDEITWPEDIEDDSPKDGFFFGIDPQGYLGLHISGDQWFVSRSEHQIPLKTWTYVSGVVDTKEGITVFIKGEEAGEMELSGRVRVASSEDLRIGMARQQIEPSHPVRTFAKLQTWYALDAAVDELKIFV